MKKLFGERDGFRNSGVTLEPSDASLHNQIAGHGPDRANYENAVAAELKPAKIEHTMAFFFESRWVPRPTRWASETPLGRPDYDEVWCDLTKARPS